MNVKQNMYFKETLSLFYEQMDNMFWYYIGIYNDLLKCCLILDRH